jgi:pyruvate-formate lyase-activating enzyme
MLTRLWLRGCSGSGTIFFGGYDVRCVFCQNSELSPFGEGAEVTASKFVGIMLGSDQSDSRADKRSRSAALRQRRLRCSSTPSSNART